jgi:hypothetical protein
MLCSSRFGTYLSVITVRSASDFNGQYKLVLIIDTVGKLSANCDMNQSLAGNEKEEG